MLCVRLGCGFLAQLVLAVFIIVHACVFVCECVYLCNSYLPLGVYCPKDGCWGVNSSVQNQPPRNPAGGSVLCHLDRRDSSTQFQLQFPLLRCISLQMVGCSNFLGLPSILHRSRCSVHNFPCRNGYGMHVFPFGSAACLSRTSSPFSPRGLSSSLMFLSACPCFYPLLVLSLNIGTLFFCDSRFSL